MSQAKQSIATEQKRRWLMKLPVISTGHLTFETANKEIGPDFNAFGRLLVVPMPEEGFMVYNDLPMESLDDDVPSDLRTCLSWAREAGFQWTRFDIDGDVIDGLPLYEW